MRFDSLVLNNIRSYTHAQLDFDEGITLLAGDIGAGKSTVLLAIEFALFGIRRGGLGGEALLRHGESHGSVTLSFTIDHTYTIHREIKRQASGVRQNTGYLIVDGEQLSLSAQELKARILEILGYPDQLLTKSKGFVYRYTVYTPQEEMKHILYEPDQDRLETLRTIFGIDRYKHIQDNAQLVAKSLRDKSRFLDGSLQDFSVREQEVHALQEQLQKLKAPLVDAELAVQHADQELSAVEFKGRELEEKIKQEHERKQALAVLDAQIKAHQAHIVTMQADIEQLQNTSKPEPVSDPSDTLALLLEKKQKIDAAYTKLIAKQQSLQDAIYTADARSDSVTAITVCPTCHQPVTSEHKHAVSQKAQETKLTNQQLLAQIEEKLSEVISKKEQAQEKQVVLTQRKEAFIAYTAKQTQFAQQQTRLQTLQAGLQDAQAQVNEKTAMRATLLTPIVDEQSIIAQKERKAQAQKNVVESKQLFASLKATQEQLNERLQLAQQTLAKLKEQKAELETTKTSEQWLSKALIPTAAVVEKHVLSKIHQECNQRFTDWLLALIEDDALFASLSPQFAPLITQNGYDVSVQHLSGGEKTSVALAYRLALNSVLNDFLSTLKTTDVLILDEPTDGFSSEQLDRVRHVLQQVGARQIILVSHEQQLESFVDSVIRIEKSQSQSFVA